MKNNKLEQVNKAIQLFGDTTTDTILYEQIVNTAVTIANADFGKLFLYNKNYIKRAHYSNERIKLNTIIKVKELNKILETSQTIITIPKETLQKWKVKQFPEEIKFLTVVPLQNKTQLLGFIFLYFKKDKRHLNSTEQDLLTLYSTTVTLALTKARLQEESKKALEIRDRFISLASHELRTPLTSIHGYIQLLHNRTKGEATVESRWIKELYTESMRMTQLVKELLDVNRIKQGQFAFVFSEVPLQEVVSRALNQHRITDTNHQFSFISKLTNEQTLVVGDFDKLVEMVSGLLSNAVKFSKSGDPITVTLKSSNNYITLTVKDKGKGISKNDLNAIFNGFYKSNHASHIEGMGVGLLLALHIVENHRGKLKIRSKENKGTTVIVTLPTIRTTNF